MATGGYEFETCHKMGDNFKCVICTWILREPMALSTCPHSFCRSCLTQWQETRNVVPYKCPTCKQTYDESQLQLNRSVDLFVRANLEVFCKKHDVGCDWSGTIDEYDLHANRDCICADVRCQNIGCTVVFLRKNQKSHATNCPMRFVPCSFCDEMITYSTLETHYKTCNMIDITCLNDGCDEKFKRKDLDKHQENCGFQIRNCVYKDIGCMVKLKRQEMDKHAKNLYEHFPLMYQEYRDMKAESISTKQKLNDTEQRLNKNINELNKNINELNKTNEILNNELNVTKNKLLNLEISWNERNVEKCMKKLKRFDENVVNYQLLFEELLYFMKSDHGYFIHGNYYFNVNLNERCQMKRFCVNVVDGRTFGGLKTNPSCVHHNNNICVCVSVEVVIVHLHVEEGWTNGNTLCYLLHPKLHEKVGVDGCMVYKDVYRDCLLNGFILLQVCRK